MKRLIRLDIFIDMRLFYHVFDILFFEFLEQLAKLSI